MEPFFQSDLLGQPLYVRYEGEEGWSRGVIRAVYLDPSSSGSEMQLYLFVAISTGRGKGSIVRLPFNSENINMEPFGVIVRLVSFPPEKRIAVIKLIRAHCGLGLKEAKDAMDVLPHEFCMNVATQPMCADEANQFADALDSEGAVVEILDGNKTRIG